MNVARKCQIAKVIWHLRSSGSMKVLGGVLATARTSDCA